MTDPQPSYGRFASEARAFSASLDLNEDGRPEPVPEMRDCSRCGESGQAEHSAACPVCGKGFCRRCAGMTCLAENGACEGCVPEEEPEYTLCPKCGKQTLYSSFGPWITCDASGCTVTLEELQLLVQPASPGMLCEPPTSREGDYPASSLCDGCLKPAMLQPIGQRWLCLTCRRAA